MKVKKKSAAAIVRRQKMYARNHRNVENLANEIPDVCEADNSLIMKKIDSDLLHQIVDLSISEFENIWKDDEKYLDAYDLFSDHEEEDIEESFRNKKMKNNSSHKNIRVVSGSSEIDLKLKSDHIKHMRKFDKICGKLLWNECRNCRRKFPGLIVTKGICSSCKKHPERWTMANEMSPGDVPEELKCLTDIETMLIAQVHPILSLFRYKGGQHIYRGNIINFAQNINSYVKILPHLPSEIPLTLIFHRSFDKNTLKFTARAEKMRNALLWLKKNNKWYKNIEISEENLSVYREDDNVTSLLSAVEIDDDDDNNDMMENDLNTFIPDIPTLNLNDKIRSQLDLPYPELDKCPINEFLKEGYISKAFPALFPYGTADFSDYHRDNDFSFKEYSKFLLMYYDRRFAEDYRLRYFLYNTNLRHQLLSQASMYIKRGSWDGSDIDSFKTALTTNPKLFDGIVAFNKKIPGTKAFWRQKCGELLGMCNQLGTPTVFFTLSAADYYWPGLFRLIAPSRTYESLSEKDRKQLMHDNPMITSFFFQYRVDQFYKLVLKPIFKVLDVWYRFEWQSRGSTHVHGVLWMADAPSFDENDYTEEDVSNLIKYFETFTFAINPGLEFADKHPSQTKFEDISSEDYDKDLRNLISHFQRHTKCSTSCLRRNVNSQKIQCRYNFPSPLKEKAEINEEEGYLRFYPQRNDALVQRYSNIVIHSWRANHDFSPICSALAIIYYIAKYITKGELSSITYQKVIKELCNNSNLKNLNSLMSSIFIKSNTDRDISAQEVCHLIMGWSLTYCSRSFITLSLYDDNYDRLNINGNQIKINKTSNIEKYRQRPSKIDNVNVDNVSLYQFLGKYGWKGNSYFKYPTTKIVNYFPVIKYNQNEKDNEPYYRQQCILHIPFRCTTETLLTFYLNTNINTWEKLYHWRSIYNVDNYDLLEVPEDDLEEIPIIDDGIRQTLAELNCGIGHKVDNDTIGKRIMDRAFDWRANCLDYPPIKEVTRYLNSYKTRPLTIPEEEVITITYSQEQQYVLDIVDNQICDILKDKKRINSFQCVVQGKAGSGKSTLIKEIVRRIKNKLSSDAVKVCAPTGAAALNIDGTTFNSEFRLPNNPKDVHPLSDRVLKQLQSDLRNMQFIIIDEMSMIGANRLWQLHCRLCELNSKPNVPFGGKIIYFFGDFRQLPPVLDTPLYARFASTPTGVKGLKLFQSITSKIELQCTYRQATDKRFAALVERIGVGIVTENDYELLSTRNAALLSSTELEDFKNAVHLCSINANVRTANNLHLERLQSPIAEIRAICKPNIDLKSKEEDCIALQKILYLSVGCRVMLTKNLWTPAGLVNGAMGTVTAIVYDRNDNSNLPPDLPLYILVKFDKYYGPTFYDDSVPIVLECAYWKYDNKEYFRKQFPLILCYATSIHKSQGLTLSKIIIDIGPSEFTAGITYVAITRARTLKDIIFKPFFPIKRLSRIGNGKMMKIKVDFIKSF